MKRNLSIIALACAVACIGLLGGWVAARQSTAAEAAEDAHAAGGARMWTPQALANLGVTVGEAKLSDFVRHAKVQATVVDAPLNAIPVAAPLGGVVARTMVEPGGVVAGGASLVRIVRAPIPRPQLTLTADLLAPASENLHESVARLRTATSQAAIVRTELARVRRFAESGTDDGLPVLPRKTLIDLEYDLARAEQERLNAVRELERHGLSADEVESVVEGALPPGNQRLWQRALEQNGLWGEVEARILAALPETERARPWSIAAIGELSAAGLANDALARSLTDVPRLATDFVTVAALLLDGSSVARVRMLAEAGALEPVMELCAPADAPDLDVLSLDVRAGQRVEAGDTVAVLHDARTMWMRLEPVGEEVRRVAAAFEAGTPLSARPLVSEAGPELAGLTIARLETRGDQEQRGSVAVLVAANRAMVPPGGGARSWRLRVGLRYLVLVPETTLAQRFVLPADAVAEAGPDRVVFLRDGKGFRAQPVHVEYEDEDVAVVANDGSIYPGDPIVLTGAFALGLALGAGNAVVDPHAGHNHG
jgi:multidrug efflux pump subunit AcrA (membrane-fusion protein)